MPNTVKQGENIIVTITGSSFTGATAVSFGDNITINEFNVTGETQISANITIAERAIGGTRTVSVTTPAGTGALADSFTIERVLRTVVWTDEDFDWLSHFLTGDGKYAYHIHLQEGNKMAVTSAINFNFGIEVRDGKLCYTSVPASAWDNVYYTSYPHLRYDTVNRVMITDSLPLEVLERLFDPPEDTMPMIESMSTGNGTITLTYYSP
jgi:GTP cyclohydrolase III